MAEVSARAWSRPQDWVELVVGVVVALSPLWVGTSAAAISTLIVLGVLVALDGLWSLAAPGVPASEGVQVVLGVLLFIAPWVLGFTALGGASWTAWVGGVITVAAGLAALPAASSAHRVAGQH